MMNDNARSLIVGATALVTGLCVGVGAGILFAPHSGARTRRHLRSFAEDRVEDTVEIADKVIERGRRSWPYDSAWAELQSRIEKVVHLTQNPKTRTGSV